MIKSTINKICVFCGSSYGVRPDYVIAVKRLSEVFVEQDITLVYGGANVGLMGKLADHIINSGGKVIGIIPSFLKELEIEHRGLTQLIEVQTMHERKDLMEKLSDGFIALPGGFGTFEEILEMITWGQLRLHHKPCGFLNINGYYNLLDKFLNNAVEEGFIEKEFKDLIIFNHDPLVMVKRFQQYEHHKIDKAKNTLIKMTDLPNDL